MSNHALDILAKNINTYKKRLTEHTLLQLNKQNAMGIWGAQNRLVLIVTGRLEMVLDGESDPDLCSCYWNAAILKSTSLFISLF